MKRYFLILCLLTLAIGSYAQTKNHRLGIALGGGPQDYKGDLGNDLGGGFQYDKRGGWRGAVVLQAGYYLNRSFDLGLFGSVGDYGYVQPDNVANEQIGIDDRCPGCAGRVGLGNLSARITAAGLMFKYKIANGYLLKEQSRIQPYVYLGSALNRVSDRMKMNCVKPGDYFSLNAGAGLRYYITDRINIGYNMGIGYFTRDDLDNMSHGANDLYMQHSLLLGVDVF